MKLNIHFEPELVKIKGTIIITDEDGKIIDEYEQFFAYKWNEFGEIMDLDN